MNVSNIRESERQQSSLYLSIKICNTRIHEVTTEMSTGQEKENTSKIIFEEGRVWICSLNLNLSSQVQVRNVDTNYY